MCRWMSITKSGYPAPLIGLEADARTHRCGHHGARADLSDSGVAGDVGAAALSTTWIDPTVDPAQRAFYYVRVLENRTCRWTTHRALARGVPIPEPALVKERAWSSPIWYSPPAE